MKFIQPIWQDLRAKRLWPLALGLLVAIGAVPVALSSSSSVPAAPPVASLPSTSAPGLPAVNETSAPSNRVPSGQSRNPFSPTGGAASGTTTTIQATPVPSTGPSAGGGPAAGGTPGGGFTGPGTSTGSPTGPSLPPTIPVGKPKRTIPALGAQESYAVKLAITESSGGLNTINPLRRLMPLPSASQPLLVELGVMKGGSRVLFAVQPGAVVSGKGTCIPGPIHCEILSLAQSQTEKLSVRSDGKAIPVALFAVTGITAVKHASRSAAQKARRVESAAGRRVLRHSTLNALSLFRYETSLGAVADLRNLSLRGS